MRTSAAAALSLGLFATASSALRLIPRGDGPPAVVGITINRKHVADPVKRDRIRRRQTQTVSETLDNEETLYFANVTLGTPGQSLRLHIDTGSSDLWTNSPNSQLCESRYDPCSVSGTYDPDKSSTGKLISSDFNISYVDGTGALGDYRSDTLNIGGAKLENLQFGLGLDSSSPEGILGIGYPVNEIQVNRNNKKQYSNVPQAMVDANLIQSSAYSLWLDDLESSTGSILFGGIDTKKFKGELSTLPIEKEFGIFAEFFITLTGVSLTSGGNSDDFNNSGLPTPVLLDSGSSLTYLPNDLTEDIYTALNVTYEAKGQEALCDCRIANTDATLDFTFTSPKISVPMSELAINPGPNEDGSTATFDDGTPLCIFGISPADGTPPVLGDTFIRSAYIVYDMGNNEISIAQTDFNATDSNVIAIGTGTEAVPSATPVASPVEASVSETGGARLAEPTASGTISASASPTGGAMGVAPSSAGMLALGGVAVVLALA
ncbi:MAG: hypothetical protein Q9195_007566 [Heterodermia aff. obscurata]